MSEKHTKICEELEFLEHQIVCHKNWFVNPDTGVHTQEIESFRSVLKNGCEKGGYNMRPADNLLSYCGKFLWRRKEVFKTFVLL